jgi:hypothetical protein
MNGGLTRVSFELSDEDGFGPAGESIWARPLGDDRYEIRNIPFLVGAAALGDVVRAVSSQPNELPVVTEVVQRSGNRTLSVFCEADRHSEMVANIKAIGAGVGLEAAAPGAYAVNIPPDLDLAEVIANLESHGAEVETQEEV